MNYETDGKRIFWCFAPGLQLRGLITPHDGERNGDLRARVRALCREAWLADGQGWQEITLVIFPEGNKPAAGSPHPRRRRRRPMPVESFGLSLWRMGEQLNWIDFPGYSPH